MGRKRRQVRRELGEGELEILKVLWDEGPSTVREVLSHLHAQGRKVAYTTVLTVLTRLEQKGFVESNKSGLAYVYRARATRDSVVRARLDSVIEQLFDGAAGSLVLKLMETERFSAEEVEEFKRLIDRLDREGEGS